MSRDARHADADPHRWVVFALVSPVYFLSLFNRVAPSVITPDLMDAFHADATLLGLMSSMYFWFYAAEQPFVGYLTDRFGPRRIAAFWAFLGALGCFLFGAAPSAAWAMAGRALVGLGAGGIYVPAMKAFAQWFRKGEFATVNGFLLSLGNLGAIVATTPLVWMVEWWGWRTSFVVIGAISLVCAAAIAVVMREHPTTGKHGQDVTTPRPPLREVASSLRFWFPVLIFLGVFGSFVTFQGLWATAYLMSVFPIERLSASGLNMLIPLGFIVGAPLSGWLVDRVFRGKVSVMILFLAVEAVIWFVLMTGGRMLGQGGMAALIFVMGGACGGLATVLWAWVRDTTPASVMGFTTGLINPSTFVGVAVLQVVTGTILDRVGRVDGGAYPPGAYQSAFFACFLIVAACLVMTVLLRKRLAGGSGVPPARVSS